MVAAAQLGETLGYTAPGTAERIREIVAQFHLPAEIDAPRSEYETTMNLDKKSQGDRLNFVFLEEIGKARTVGLSKRELFARL